MEKFRFLNWEVYQVARLLFKEILLTVDTLPTNHKFGVGNQITRSSSSIVLNIAEGSGKNSAKELNCYLDIALGSVYETLAGLDLLREAQPLSTIKFDAFRADLSSVANQLGGFKKKLRGSFSSS